MQTDTLLLIDLSSLAHPIFHMSASEPDPNHTSTQIIARVRALASEHPHAAICCDAGRSFRADLDPTYKANRPESLAPLHHQIQLAEDVLKRDGFPVWKVKGFEADDLIATATSLATAIDGTSVLIASADKDLLQLVGQRVTAKSLTNGNIIDIDAVIAKFGVRPEQMLDYLSLVGDVSDNVKGAKGVGAVIAAKLLKEHGTIEAIYAKMAQGVVSGLTPSVRASFTEFYDRWPTVRSLIELRTDAPIPFAEIAAERTPAPMMTADDYADADLREPLAAPVPFQKGNDANDAPLFQPALPSPTTNGEAAIQKQFVGKSEVVVPYAGPVDFSQQLEPRTMPEAITLAKHLFESRLFSAYGTPQAVLSTILAGRELGIPAMASLRAFAIIEGKPTMSAGAMLSLVLKSGKAKYFRCTERTDTRATFVTQRGDDPQMSLTYTIQEAEQAGLIKEKGSWKKNPADMLVARASSKLARLVFPDVVMGLYAPEEFNGD